MKRDDGILLISCYELGHQPFSLASPAARLKSEGYDVSVVDAAIEPVPEDIVRGAGFIGISVPMHTAMRVGMDLSRRIRKLNPGTHLCYYGLYATLNADYLLTHGADSVIGGEFEQPLCDLVDRLCAGSISTLDGESRTTLNLSRQVWTTPNRDALPGLKRYAQLDTGVELLPAGHTETTRGCLHTCLHCPITPVYRGRFYAIPADVVLADVDQQVRMGARHITFGDPDFLNGPTHVLRILRKMRDAHPGLTFDFTTKIEHILEHASFFSEARALGGIFVVSAVESVSDLVLRRLKKRTHPRRYRPGPRHTAGRGYSHAALADGVHTLDDAGRLPGSIGFRRSPRPGRSYRPGAVYHPPARTARFCPAGRVGNPVLDRTAR